jgi:hypothetical protein
LRKNNTPFGGGVDGSPVTILMKLKMPGQARPLLWLMVFSLLNGFPFFPAFAEGESQEHHKKSGEHHSRTEKEDEKADDEKEGNGEKNHGHHREGESHYSERDKDDIEGKERNEKEKGDEVTGFIAAGLFGLANLSAIFSILSRNTIRLIGSREAFKNALLAVNRFQQKHLRRFHYLLNIAAIAVASLHWYLSESASVAFQQVGMVLAIFLGFSGIMIKHRLLPQLLHRGLFYLHASLFMAFTALTLLVAGHAFIDDWFLTA